MSLPNNNSFNMINTRKHSMNLESAEDMVQSLNSEGIILDVSPGWLKITGYKRVEVIGRYFFDFLIDESISETKLAFPHLKDYGFIDNVLLKIKRRDGVIIETILNGTSKYDTEGEFQRTFCEIRNLEYFVDSFEEINKILNREKLMKSFFQIKSNINKLLLQKKHEDSYEEIIEILKEPTFVENVLLESDMKAMKSLNDDLFIVVKENSSQENKSDLGKYEIIMKFKDDSMSYISHLIIIHASCNKYLYSVFEEGLKTIAECIQAVQCYMKMLRENNRLLEELGRLVEIDKLTNIYNRMKLDKILEERKSMFDRYRVKSSVIMIDIDKFKEVNDRFGHIAGDKVLIEFAELLSGNIRKTDLVGRWGGEEFMVICDHTDLASASVLAESLRKKIEKHFFTKIERMSASFGVSEFLEMSSIEQIVNMADKALYDAKLSGRNRVVKYISKV